MCSSQWARRPTGPDSRATLITCPQRTSINLDWRIWTEDDLAESNPSNFLAGYFGTYKGSPLSLCLCVWRDFLYLPGGRATWIYFKAPAKPLPQLYSFIPSHSPWSPQGWRVGSLAGFLAGEESFNQFALGEQLFAKVPHHRHNNLKPLTIRRAYIPHEYGMGSVGAENWVLVGTNPFLVDNRPAPDSQLPVDPLLIVKRDKKSRTSLRLFTEEEGSQPQGKKNLNY